MITSFKGLKNFLGSDYNTFRRCLFLTCPKEFTDEKGNNGTHNNFQCFVMYFIENLRRNGSWESFG